MRWYSCLWFFQHSVAVDVPLMGITSTSIQHACQKDKKERKKEGDSYSLARCSE